MCTCVCLVYAWELISMYICNVLCKCIYWYVIYLCIHACMDVCTRIGICRWVLSFMFNVYLFVCACVSPLHVYVWVSMMRVMYVCVNNMYVCGLPVYVCTCGVHVWVRVWVYFVYVLIFPSSLCVWLRVTGFRTRSCDPNSVMGDSDLYPFWTRYTGDSKFDPWDNPEIRTSSCSEDQMAIRFQNRIISCECLFSCLFHICCC